MGVTPRVGSSPTSGTGDPSSAPDARKDPDERVLAPSGIAPMLRDAGLALSVQLHNSHSPCEVKEDTDHEVMARLITRCPERAVEHPMPLIAKWIE